MTIRCTVTSHTCFSRQLNTFVSRQLNIDHQYGFYLRSHEYVTPTLHWPVVLVDGRHVAYGVLPPSSKTIESCSVAQRASLSCACAYRSLFDPIRVLSASTCVSASGATRLCTDAGVASVARVGSG